MHNRIPLSRGLGSSASATVAGLLAADALAGGGLTPERLLTLACHAEGHADNAAAALLGGFVVVSHAAGDAQAVRIEPPAGLLAALFIPDRPLSTSAMRAALQGKCPSGCGPQRGGRLAGRGRASGRLDLLTAATDDRLHEPYRAAVYPELPLLIAAARQAVLGACLSGAGSSVIAFADRSELADAVAAAMAEGAAAAGLPGHALVVRPRVPGASARLNDHRRPGNRVSLADSATQLADAPLDEPPFRAVGSVFQRRPIGDERGRHVPEPPEQVGTHQGGERVVGQSSLRFDGCQASARHWDTASQRDRDGRSSAMNREGWSSSRSINSRTMPVQVGVRGGRRGRMERRDPGLETYGPAGRPDAAAIASHQLPDAVLVPTRSILLLHGQGARPARRLVRRAGLLQQHQRQQGCVCVLLVRGASPARPARWPPRRWPPGPGPHRWTGSHR